jgi:tetratricopeptide (TPR) repeat protein
MAFLDVGRRDLAWPLAAREPGKIADALASFHHLRAGLREEHQDFAGAEADLRRALTLDPDLSESSVNLGALLLGRKREREAIEVLTRLLERRPRSDGALRNRGAAYLSLGQLDAGAADLEAAQRILPMAPIARLLAQVYQSQKKTDLARRWSDAARALDPAGR